MDKNNKIVPEISTDKQKKIPQLKAVKHCTTPNWKPKELQKKQNHTTDLQQKPVTLKAVQRHKIWNQGAGRRWCRHPSRSVAAALHTFQGVQRDRVLGWPLYPGGETGSKGKWGDLGVDHQQPRTNIFTRIADTNAPRGDRQSNRRRPYDSSEKNGVVEMWGI